MCFSAKSAQQRKRPSWMLLFWARLNTPFLKRIPLSVAREICCFFDNRIVDVQNSTLFLLYRN